jgi:Haem-binding domain
MARAARWPAVAAMAIVAIQFIPVERRNFPVKTDLLAPPPVKAALRNACYDCHSNRTRWPWYGAIAPASWLVAHEVNEGCRRLNFSDWDAYGSDPGTARHKLNEIANFVTSGKMAPWYYLMLHPGARLSRAQRDMVVGWARGQSSRAVQ